MASEAGRKRGGSETEPSPTAKRPKPEPATTDPSKNPYLAHMYGDDAESNGYGADKGKNSGGSILSTFKRHATTSKQAQKAEDGPANPFNQSPLSSRYFQILEGRRNLPVHAQR